MTRELVMDYLDRSIATYDGDPPANDYQRGHLDALKVARAELVPLNQWLPLSDAPRDGTMVWLLIVYGAHGTCPLTDARVAATLGFNNHEHDEDWPEHRWQFVAWNWEQDCFHDHVSDVHEVVPAGWRPIGFDLDQTPVEEGDPPPPIPNPSVRPGALRAPPEPTS